MDILMSYQKLEPFIIEAINEYLKNIQDKLFEINTAVATLTLPTYLIDLIKNKLNVRTILEKNSVIVQLNKIQNEEKKQFLSLVGIKKAEANKAKLAMERDKLAIDIKEHGRRIDLYLENFKLGRNPGCIRNGGFSINEISQEAESFDDDLKTILIPIINSTRFAMMDNYPLFANKTSNDLLFKMYWAREIKTLRTCIADLEQKRDELLTQENKIEFLLSASLAADETDCKIIKSHLHQTRRDELKQRVISIRKEYDFNSLSSTEMSLVFENFIAALRPHIAINPNFRDTLHQFDIMTNRKQDLTERREALCRIINQRILGLGSSKGDKDKILRLNDLKRKLEAVDITITTTLTNLERVITNWQLAEADGIRNNDLFNRSSKLYKFFHNEPRLDEQFMSQCLALVKEYPQQPMPVYQNPPPVYVKSQSPSVYPPLPSVGAFNLK